MICAFTGHRPKNLPWGSREDDPRCVALKTLLYRAVEQAAERGCHRFLCGMAMGCDTYFAEAVLEQKAKQPELTLEPVIPCPGQADRWPEADKQRYALLVQQCDHLTVLEDSYFEHCMQRRNHYLVDQADLLISVWDGTPGGTGSTVRYAKETGVEILPIWL